MKRVLKVLAIIVGAYLILRAAVDPFLRDRSDPSTFETAWGGPTYIGALAAHMGPGIICAILFLWWFIASRRTKATKQQQADTGQTP